MNKWIGTIRLTADAEIRYTNDGKPIVRFSGACNRRFKQDGQPDADFFSFVGFGKTAESFEKCNIGKGTKLLIEGEVRNNHYTDKDGVKHYSEQIVVNAFEFCESKASGGQASAPDQSRSDDGFMNIPDGIDEDLPFS